MIRVKVQHASKMMLSTQATRLGQIGDDIYFVLDGKAWRISADVAFRSEDDQETAALLRLCRDAGFPGNRPCTGCNTQFGINPTIAVHRRGYCSIECEKETD